jgi:hypothetical protein
MLFAIFIPEDIAGHKARFKITIQWLCGNSVLGAIFQGAPIKHTGKDILLETVFKDYPNPKRPVDFVISKSGKVLAVGLARYDSDRSQVR